jgi:hypothetical protein
VFKRAECTGKEERKARKARRKMRKKEVRGR